MKLRPTISLMEELRKKYPAYERKYGEAKAIKYLAEILNLRIRDAKWMIRVNRLPEVQIKVPRSKKRYEYADGYETPRNARLTFQQVQRLRFQFTKLVESHKTYYGSKMSAYKQLAKEYNVSQSTIIRAVSGDTWQDPVDGCTTRLYRD